jgi:hypothetical protein
MTTPSFTTPPTAPARDHGQDAFNTEMPAFLAYIVTFRNELVTGVGWIADQVTAIVAYVAAAAASALAAATSATAALAATGYMRRSTATLSVGTGVKAVTGLNSPSAASFANLDEVAILDANDAERRMWGVVSNANMGAGTMDVTVASGDFAGGSSGSNWIVVHRAFENLLGATVAEIRAAATAVKALTPKGMKDAAATVALTFASTVAWDVSAGKRRTLTASGSFIMGAPSNCAPGDELYCLITHSAGGNVLAVNGAWVRENGLGVLSTVSGRKDRFIGLVEEVDGSGNMTLGSYKIIRNET